ncbi:MAG TPA: zinc ribbon domain-containing protein [Steroidobacter sp.]|jgi:hypothetical protein|nr:zinc ribbon domain-containing protein [Steroidobacter sp.]
MPTYEYLCEANGRVMEVSHKMSERVATWGELCERVGLSPGATPPDAPVTKMMSAGFVGVSSGSTPEPRPCEMGASCCGNVCGGN